MGERKEREKAINEEAGRLARVVDPYIGDFNSVARGMLITDLVQTFVSLLEERDRLREVITPFALAYDSAPDYLKEGPDTVCIWDTEASNVITIGDLRKVVAALKEVGNG